MWPRTHRVPCSSPLQAKSNNQLTLTKLSTYFVVDLLVVVSGHDPLDVVLNVTLWRTLVIFLLHLVAIHVILLLFFELVSLLLSQTVAIHYS